MKKYDNPLTDFFYNSDHNLMNKWLHYFDIYHSHLDRFRDKKITILEFGVSHGGSLQMWKKYFGTKARIIGVDIDPECKELEEQQVEVYIGSQEDRKFLKKLMKKIGSVDIIIDDGGHTMTQQITTFEETYKYVKSGGVYLTEDLHTSYWGSFGGGLHKQGTFIEYTKALVDKLNAWYIQDAKELKVDEFTKTTTSIHFYDSIVVFEKSAIKEPKHQQIGTPTLSILEESKYRQGDKPKIY